MSDPRWPDDGPTWPERDLEEDTRNPWADEPRSSGFDAEEPEPPRPPEPEPEPVFEPAPEPEPVFQTEPPFEPEPAFHPEPPLQPEPPTVEAGEPTTAFDDPGWNPKLHGERRRPTTAEQAVPWMIGVILALAGIVIVLLALIFTAPEGMLAGSGSPSPSGSAGGLLPSQTGAASPTPGATASQEPASPTPQPTEGPSPTPVPEYGPLEMVYLGRPSALEPIYLLRRDFSVEEDPDVLAQADIGVTAFAWSPDGRVGAAIVGGRLVAIQPGETARALTDNVAAVTFAADSETLYAVRVVRDGANDRARVMRVAWASGDVSQVASVVYPRPVIGADPALREAQFIDDGGTVRIYALADGRLAVWILGAPSTYHVDPADGTVAEVDRVPTLWSPDGQRRIEVRENDNGTTTLVLRDSTGDQEAAVQVGGLVSHLRWVRSNNEVVFTLGRLSANGGVRQDLFVWDLTNRRDPLPLTSNGVSFGAEWRGVAPNWLP